MAVISGPLRWLVMSPDGAYRGKDREPSLYGGEDMLTLG